MKYESLKSGVVKRRVNHSIAIFIDGVGLDRATRRIERKVEIAALVKALASGLNPAVVRYYTLIPFEDDSRHRAFLNTLSKAGVSVVLKRLPPKTVTRQVSMDPEIAADMLAFAAGVLETKDGIIDAEAQGDAPNPPLTPSSDEAAGRSVIVVCGSRDLSYPLTMVRKLGCETTNADFGGFAGNEVLKAANKWIDLTDSETIWRDGPPAPTKAAVGA